MATKTLIIVNCQKDFIYGNVVINGAKEKIDALVDYLKKDGLSYDAIIAVMDSHQMGHISFKEASGIWKPHCIMFTDGWSLYEPLEEELDRLSAYGVIVNKVYKGMDKDKEEYSALSDDLNRQVFDAFCKPVSQIDIAGLSGEYSLYHTVKDLANVDGGKAYRQKMKLLYDYIADTDNHTILKKLEKYSAIGKPIDD